jgi:hypothetical protein
MILYTDENEILWGGKKNQAFSTGTFDFETFESRQKNGQFSLPHYILTRSML